jgi:uncharacterized protein
MKISGTATLHAPPPEVWTALNDPAVLARTIPGCEHLEAAGPDSYRLTITAGVASIQGTYTGTVSLADRQEPTSSRLVVNLAGAPGTLSASVLVLLVPSGNDSTEVTYAADATPDGKIAAVGQRLLASTAKQLASDFFTSVDDLLVTRAARPAPSAAPPQGVRVGGAAGVSSPAAPPTQGASGMTRELPTDDRQPAGRPLARPHTGSFVQGALAGAAATLAGVSVARLLRRRSR